jgi:hypothetical protein
MFCYIRLNNRKAKLARTTKDISVPDKQKGPVRVSSDSPDNLGEQEKILISLE